MAQSKIIDDADPALEVYQDLPNHVGTKAEFIAAVNEGLADIEADRTVSFAAVAADLRRTMHRQA